MQTMPLPKSRAVKALSTGGQSWLPPGSVKLAAQLHYEVQMNTMAQEIGAEKALSDQKLNLKYCEVIVSTGQDMIGYHKLPSTGGGGGMTSHWELICLNLPHILAQLWPLEYFIGILSQLLQEPLKRHHGMKPKAIMEPLQSGKAEICLGNGRVREIRTWK